MKFHFLLLSLTLIFNGVQAQKIKYNKSGKVKFVSFEKLKGDLAPPSTSQDFIYKYLTKNKNHIIIGIRGKFLVV